MPGQGKPDCENFHYSGDLARTVAPPVAPPAPKHIDPLYLSIELDPEPQEQAPRKWRLRLTVPKALDAHGQIAINLGGTDTRQISLTKLAVGPETYTVDLNAVDFCATWVSPDVRREYREAVQHRVSGLRPQKANAFAADRSKLKPRTYSLLWGESYYLVWRADCAIVLPAALPSKPLARMNGWDCALVALPHDPDTDVELWVRIYCDLTIARSTRDWAVIYPAPYALGDGGELHIPTDSHLILALKSAGAGPPGNLTCSSGQSPAVVELTDSRHHFVSIRGVTDKDTHLAWDGAFVATLAIKPYSASEEEIAVGILGDGPQGEVRAHLHLSAGQALMSDVRQHHISLLGMYGHPLLRGSIRWRQPGTIVWFEQDLRFSQSSTETGGLDDKLLHKFRSVLQDHSLDIELDFGPFGTFFADALPKATERSRAPNLPQGLRARISWLSYACRSYADDRKRPVTALNDSSLLLHYRNLRVPRRLLAHQRAIDAQLQTLSTGSSHE
jgi:hypothetical protein